MKIAIIGAGAAGCFAAANIARRSGVEVALFEKTGKVMQKVKVSGGGRCNVTHECFDIPTLVDRYPRGRQLLRKSLYRFGPQQTIDWFAARGVRLKTEDDGRMFPTTNDSQTIIDAIWQEMQQQQVLVYYHKSVKRITIRPGEAQRFLIEFADTSVYAADKVLIAAGGFPKAEQYEWLTATGHHIESPVPSLFTFNIPKHPITELMGVSVPDAAVKVAGAKTTQQGPLLITHWGMSGPAVLRTSAIAARELATCSYEFRAVVNWLGATTDDELREQLQQLRMEHGKQFVAQKNPFGLPRRLWEYMMPRCGITDQTRWGDIPAAARNKLTEHLLRDVYNVSGKTTFKEEFVTCGGIKLTEVDAQTMESRVHKDLYFAGEIMDVDGITGGYNFQHAWSSGYTAAMAMQQ
ncbi:NAD(P)/FAD-dependent oxidoreductase [Nemorincola caseinilytica]|uniref:NAD(P)/FAD-dependent oxidoreductase n=1 Tax=Nemorincola caseinilytica TaxID=2054315 RepID=A0ABP8NPC4_9BACT